jgi:hypothetical protein
MYDRMFNCIVAVYSKKLDFFVPLFQALRARLTPNVGATAVGLPLRSAPQWGEPID